jgi:alpha-beta hydrolase superfamily lysophospholipase
MVRALLVLPAVVVVLLFLLWAFQRHLIYLPSTAEVGPAGAAIPGARDVVLQTSDGLELGAWFVPAEEPDRGLSVLVANGNAGDRSGRAPLARKLAGHGLAVLLFDYRGYGGNPGSPSEDGLALDVRAARRYLVEEAGVSPARILYYGESLGAAVVTELAAEHPPAGIVLRSPFVDLAAVGHHHYPFLPVRTLVRDHYPLVGHLADVHVPVTVVYGTADSIVPAEQSRTVAESAPVLSQSVEVARADHNDPALLSGPRLVRAVVALADQVRTPS